MSCYNLSYHYINFVKSGKEFKKTQAIYNRFQNPEKGAFLDQNNLLHEILCVFQSELETRINKALK